MHFKLFKKMLDEWAVEQEPVFIVGPERSGTSLLFQQISNHPDFCDFSEATVETFCFSYPWKLFDPSTPDNYEMRLYLGQENVDMLRDQLDEVVKANQSLNEKGLPKEYLYQENSKEIWDARQYQTLLRGFFYYSWNHLGKKKLVEKTPAHIRCADKIFETFPKAKLLICLRDVAEIVASHRKRYQKEVSLGVPADADELKWLNHPLSFYLNYMAEIDAIIESLKASHGDSIKIVPYADLTIEPNKTLGDIFAFLGNAFVPPGNIQKERESQAWDPLLNKLPQPNYIDVNKYLSVEDKQALKELQNKLVNSWK